jgi:hypothetical protein
MSKEAALLMSVGRQCRWWLWECGRMVLAWGNKNKTVTRTMKNKLQTDTKKIIIKN